MPTRTGSWRPTSACSRRFAYQQPGLLRRTTARGDGSEWLVVSLWDSPASADAGDPLRADDDTCREFVSFIDPATLRSERYQELD